MTVVSDPNPGEGTNKGTVNQHKLDFTHWSSH